MSVLCPGYGRRSRKKEKVKSKKVKGKREKGE
jgi:hypothetical protein